jgi:hypothetical protein
MMGHNFLLDNGPGAGEDSGVRRRQGFGYATLRHAGCTTAAAGCTGPRTGDGRGCGKGHDARWKGER